LNTSRIVERQRSACDEYNWHTQAHTLQQSAYANETVSGHRVQLFSDKTRHEVEIATDDTQHAEAEKNDHCHERLLILRDAG
jgi:hypothetical protein